MHEDDSWIRLPITKNQFIVDEETLQSYQKRRYITRKHAEIIRAMVTHNVYKMPRLSEILGISKATLRHHLCGQHYFDSEKLLEDTLATQRGVHQSVQLMFIHHCMRENQPIDADYSSAVNTMRWLLQLGVIRIIQRD